jgi:hypothetical protein
MPRPNKASTPDRTWATLLLAVPLALAGCDKPDNAPGPGGVSMGEARALDRAAEIIEERTVEVPEPAPAPRTETQGAPLEVESTAPPIAGDATE